MESEEDFFDKMAQVGEDAIMAMIEQEIAESRKEDFSSSESPPAADVPTAAESADDAESTVRTPEGDEPDAS